jgi:hypothetical protein
MNSPAGGFSPLNDVNDGGIAFTAPKARVGEIRWLDQMTVMVAVSWYEGPEAAAGYTYVLRRNQKGEWHVQTYYMNYIS